MPHAPELIKRRNAHVRDRFRYHKKKNPKWNIIFVIKEVSEEVFLSPATITKILKTAEEEVPAVDTVVSQLATC